MNRLILWWSWLGVRTEGDERDERGMTTAELLGNAALGILALVVIWAAMKKLGVDVVSMVRKNTGA